MELNELKKRVQKLYSDNFSKTECAIIADTWAILKRESDEKIKTLEEHIKSLEDDLF